MTDLDKLLDTVKAPEPSDLLKARILREARASRPSAQPVAANDRSWKSWGSIKKWGAMAAMALVFGVVGITGLTPSTSIDETQYLAEAASDLGYDELYAWVHGEDEATNDGSNEAKLSSTIIPA